MSERLVFFPDLDRHATPVQDSSHNFDAEVRGAVRRSLTEKQREVVELYYFLGLSEPVIARRLGVSQQVVHKRLHGVVRKGRRVGGALAKLRTALHPVARVQRWL